MKKLPIVNIKKVFEVIPGSNVREKFYYSDKVSNTLKSELFTSCISTFYTLAICTNGLYEGKIDGQYYKLKSGDLIIYRPGEHHIFIGEENFEGRIISISSELFLEIDGPRNLQFQNNFLRRGYSNILPLTNSQFAIIKHYFYNFKSIIYSKGHLYIPEILKNVLKCILLEIKAQYLSAEDKKNDFSQGKEVIRTKFNELLEEKFATNHDVKFYADQLCITPDYLGKVIRKQCGKSPISLINDRLLIEAKLLLTTTEESVSHISNALHFSSQAAFSRFFTTKMGISPLTFRNKFLQVPIL